MRPISPLVFVGAIVGASVGTLLQSPNPFAKILGIAIPIAIGLFYRKTIKEVLLRNDADKTIAILSIAVIGAGIIVIMTLQVTQWYLFLLWGAWIIFSIIMLGKLSLLVTDYEFALEMKDHELARAKIQRWRRESFEEQEKC